MNRSPQIAVVGPGSPEPEVRAAAEEVGRLLAEAGARVVCGGLGGVMEAAAKGAVEAGGEVIGILPGAEIAAANAYVTHPVATALGQGRNVAVAASADAVVAVGGSWGTLSEVALARRHDRTVIGLLTWPLECPPGEDGVRLAASAADAVGSALEAARTRRS